MNRVGYARVSTIEQHLDVQLAKLTQAGCDPIFQEKRSGMDAARPVLAECLRYVRAKEALVVTHLDRLARSLTQLCAIAADLNKRQVHLMVLDQQLDTSTPSGELHFHLLGAIAQFDYRLRQTRQLEGIAAAKDRGVPFGRPHVLTHEQTLALRSDRNQGATIRELQQHYHMSRAAVYRYLKRSACLPPASQP